MKMSKRSTTSLKDTRFLIAVTTLVSLLGGSCAHKAHTPSENEQNPPQAASSLSNGRPIILRLKGSPGRAEISRYHSLSVTRSYENMHILKEQFEDLDFTVQTTTRAVNPEKGIIQQSVTTLRKDGPGSLVEMAFPEQGETIETVIDQRGNVLHVEGYPPESIFYVPSISLPENAVQVGDTWPLTAEWLSSGNGLPLKLDVVTIFKKLTPCGSDNCAELEVSGDVTVNAKSKPGTRFRSDVRGIMILRVAAGVLAWSRIQNTEQLIIENMKVDVDSCLEQQLTNPEDLKLDPIPNLHCESKNNELKSI